LQVPSYRLFADKQSSPPFLRRGNPAESGMGWFQALRKNKSKIAVKSQLMRSFASLRIER